MGTSSDPDLAAFAKDPDLTEAHADHLAVALDLARIARDKAILVGAVAILESLGEAAISAALGPLAGDLATQLVAEVKAKA